jgi:hypothetical protein
MIDFGMKAKALSQWGFSFAYQLDRVRIFNIQGMLELMNHPD